MTFIDWLKDFEHEQSPYGDVARDVLNDEHLGEDVDWVDVYVHARDVHHASGEALWAIKSCGAEYDRTAG